MSKRNTVKFVLSFIAYYLISSFINYDLLWFKSMSSNMLGRGVIVLTLSIWVLISYCVVLLAETKN
jgi:hypothetical protein